MAHAGGLDNVLQVTVQPSGRLTPAGCSAKASAENAPDAIQQLRRGRIVYMTDDVFATVQRLWRKRFGAHVALVLPRHEMDRLATVLDKVAVMPQFVGVAPGLADKMRAAVPTDRRRPRAKRIKA